MTDRKFELGRHELPDGRSFEVKRHPLKYGDVYEFHYLGTTTLFYPQDFEAVKRKLDLHQPLRLGATNGEGEGDTAKADRE